MLVFLLFFVYSLIADETPASENCPTKPKPNKTFAFVTKTNEGYKKVIAEVFQQRGIIKVGSDASKYHDKYDQDIIWGQCSWLTDGWFLRQMRDDQRCSNFPFIHMLVWKTNLQWHIHNNKLLHPSLNFSFWPPGFNLEHADEFESLEKLYVQHEALPEPRDPLGIICTIVHTSMYYLIIFLTTQILKSEGLIRILFLHDLVYIIKNPFKNAGSGIHLIDSLKGLRDLKKPNSPMYPIAQTKPLAQKYIHNPLLVVGHKTTFRVC